MSWPRKALILVISCFWYFEPVAFAESELEVLVEWDFRNVEPGSRDGATFVGVSAEMAKCAKGVEVTRLETASNLAGSRGLVWSDQSLADGGLHFKGWDHPDENLSRRGNGSGVPNNWLEFELQCEPGMGVNLQQIEVKAWRNGKEAPANWAFSLVKPGDKAWQRFGGFHEQRVQEDARYLSVWYADSVAAPALRVRFLAFGPDGGTGTLNISSIRLLGTQSKMEGSRDLPMQNLVASDLRQTKAPKPAPKSLSKMVRSEANERLYVKFAALLAATSNGDGKHAKQLLEQIERSDLSLSEIGIARSIVKAMDQQALHPAPKDIAERRRVKLAGCVWETAIVPKQGPVRNCYHPKNAQRYLLECDDQIYTSGLAAPPNAEYVFDLGGAWSTLQGVAGLLPSEASLKRTVDFMIIGDDQLLHGFRREAGRRGVEQFRIDVRGVQQLKLITKKFTSEDSEVDAIWADLELERIVIK